MSPPRRSRRSRRRSRSRRRLLVVVAVVLSSVVALGIWWTRPPDRPDLGTVLGPERPPSPARPEGRPPPPAVPETGVVPEALPADTPAAREARVAAGAIAIVIDDLGRSIRDVEVLAGLGIPLTYAVLPYESRTSEVVAELRRRGVEIFVHLPMEAAGGANPGPGALLLAMSSEELRTATRQALEAVPGAVGVNNHMGSGMSTRVAAMRPVLEVVSERGLGFLDSRTSPETVAYREALELGIPTGERDVFLDVERTPEFIREQFDRLLDLSGRQGSAIAIAHPHEVTMEMLAELVPEARAQGFEFVTVTELLRRDPAG